MSDYKPLNSEEIKEISSDYFNARGKVAAHVESPVIVLIGAQPGAGKSKIADIAKDELKELCKIHEIDVSDYKGTQPMLKIARNLVDYEAGRTIFETVLGIEKKSNVNQVSIFDTIT